MEMLITITIAICSALGFVAFQRPKHWQEVSRVTLIGLAFVAGISMGRAWSHSFSIETGTTLFFCAAAIAAFIMVVGQLNAE